MDPSAVTQWCQSGIKLSITQLESGVQAILDHRRDQVLPFSFFLHTAASDSKPLVVTISHEPRLSSPELFRDDPEQCLAFLTQCEIQYKTSASHV